MADAHHSIKIVARRTGLSAHVIRIWEKRYGAVAPERTGTNRRLYSEDQIERLSLLRDITHSGHSISHVAKLPLAKLKGLATEAAGSHRPTAHTNSRTQATPSYLEECIEAVKTLNSSALEDTFKRAAISLGAQGLLQRVIAPLAQTIGDLWRDGTITAAHEHFASGVIRVFLGHSAKQFSTDDNAPVIVVATPAGQLHELGALLAAAAAANLGWNVTYLGTSLPAAEIAGAAKQNNARAVALSLVYPEDDSRLDAELTRLRLMLPPEIILLAGGRAMPAYREALDQIGVLQIKDLAHLCATLEDLRRTKRKT